MDIIIHPTKLQGQIKAIPSKSQAHRFLICAAFSDRVTTLICPETNQDIEATVGCLCALGANIQRTDDGYRIEPVKSVPSYAELHCRESGSTLRFLLPVVGALGVDTLFHLQGRLAERPLSPLWEEMEAKGCTLTRPSKQTIRCHGKLNPEIFTIDGSVSSQFISGLLFALPLLSADSRITITTAVESRSYISLTIKALAEFGVSVRWEDEHTLLIPGNQCYQSREISVEGDYSNAAFLEALNLFSGEVTVKGLVEESLQGDKIYRQYFPMLEVGVPTLHIGDCPDLGPILFAIAAAKNGGVFSGTRRLRIKESDRAAAMASELRKFGATVTLYDDSVVVFPGSFHSPTEPLLGHNDHRIVMALSVLLSFVGGTIRGAEAIRKSYPTFFHDITKLGICVTEQEDSQ